MTVKETCTYEKVYLALWETGQRYGKFAQFRVIGRSHDDRMIPMLEIGKGDICIFCVSGIGGKDGIMPEYLLRSLWLQCDQESYLQTDAENAEPACGGI